jgi:hypothetical protein
MWRYVYIYIYIYIYIYTVYASRFDIIVPSSGAWARLLFMQRPKITHDKNYLNLNLDLFTHKRVRYILTKTCTKEEIISNIA